MMRIAYLDCSSGISGDMFLGALIDAGLKIEDLKRELNKLNISGWNIESKKIEKNPIPATKFDVNADEHHAHRHLKDIEQIIDQSAIGEKSKTLAKKIFRNLAAAEAKVHGTEIESIHFHEVGAIDAIIDIVGASVAVSLLKIEKFHSSKINLGGGKVRCAHGTLPVPAPATAELLKQNHVPVYSDTDEGELTTPTGAAIISTIAESFGPMPEIKISSIGTGAGTKDFTHPNILRIFIGETDDEKASDYDTDEVDITETNIDDQNPEITGHTLELLMKSGALDAFITPIHMKKSRPAMLLTAITRPEDTKKIIGIIFRETTTFGVRTRREKRMKLTVEKKEIETEYGKLTIKLGKDKKGNILQSSPEYESAKALCEKTGVPLKKIYCAAKD